MVRLGLTQLVVKKNVLIIVITNSIDVTDYLKVYFGCHFLVISSRCISKRFPVLMICDGEGSRIRKRLCNIYILKQVYNRRTVSIKYYITD